jgi:polyisoprenoid-binding protein YceI
MKKILALCALAVLAACSQQKEEAAPPAPQTAAEAASTPTEVPPPVAGDVPAGDYTLDKMHASLIFRVDHLGFSNYTARFKKFDAKLTFDPKNLAASTLTATVDPTSLETDFPDPAKIDFNATLQNEQWLDTKQYPQMTYQSKTIEVVGPNKMRVTGDFTLHGVTKPVVLDATFNGGYKGHPMDPNARIGFSARGTLKRSEFGIAYGIPDPGSKFGVGDDVEIIIESEFNGPPLPDAPAPTPGT